MKWTIKDGKVEWGCCDVTDNIEERLDKLEQLIDSKGVREYEAGLELQIIENRQKIEMLQKDLATTNRTVDTLTDLFKEHKHEITDLMIGSSGSKEIKRETSTCVYTDEPKGSSSKSCENCGRNHIPVVESKKYCLKCCMGDPSDFSQWQPKRETLKDCGSCINQNKKDMKYSPCDTCGDVPYDNYLPKDKPVASPYTAGSATNTSKPDESTLSLERQLGAVNANSKLAAEYIQELQQVIKEVYELVSNTTDVVTLTSITPKMACFMAKEKLEKYIK